MYEKFISQLRMYAKVIIIENKLIFFQTLWQKREFPPVGFEPDASRLPDNNSFEGFFANFSFATIKIARNSRWSQKAIQISNPDYDIVIKQLCLYYDMKLAMFGINEERNLIVQFAVFVQPYTQMQLILYEVEWYQFLS